MGIETTIGIAGSAVTLAGAGVAAGGWLVRRALRPIAQMAEDWTGEQARPGVPARPGVMERLARIEDAIRSHTADGHGGQPPAPADAVPRPRTPIWTGRGAT